MHLLWFISQKRRKKKEQYNIVNQCVAKLATNIWDKIFRLVGVRKEMRNVKRSPHWYTITQQQKPPMELQNSWTMKKSEELRINNKQTPQGHTKNYNHGLKIQILIPIRDHSAPSWYSNGSSTWSIPIWWNSYNYYPLNIGIFLLNIIDIHRMVVDHYHQGPS